MRRASVLLRSRGPALCLAALFHVALITLLLRALPVPVPKRAILPETEVVFLPLPERPARKERPRVSGGERPTAITPYFNPDTFNPNALRALNPRADDRERLSLALASCAPENYDRQSVEIREACSRIQVAMTAMPDRFGVTVDFLHGERWQQELLKRNRPVLAPCMTPGGPDVLHLLTCVYDVIFDGYDSEKMMHY